MTEEPRHTNRRTVLKTAGGLLAGTTMLAGLTTAEPAELDIDVKQEALNPANNGVIPVEVTVPQELADHSNFPGLVYFGPKSQFHYDGGQLYGADTEDVANPVRIRTTGPDRGNFLMHFRTEDIDFSGVVVEDGMITMVVAIIDGIIVPGTDRVQFVQPRDR